MEVKINKQQLQEMIEGTIKEVIKESNRAKNPRRERLSEHISRQLRRERLQEGLWSNVKGVAKAIGKKASNAGNAIGRQVDDVMRAGKIASHIDDIKKIYKKLEEFKAKYADELKASNGDYSIKYALNALDKLTKQFEAKA